MAKDENRPVRALLPAIGFHNISQRVLHGLGPGHNRATARTHPNAIPNLVKRFKEAKKKSWDNRFKAKTTFIRMEK